MSSSDSLVDLLTSDLLLAVLSWLELRDLVSCCQATKAFRTCAMDQNVYKALACRRFGKDLVESTLALYRGDYRAMMADDNKIGAVPMLFHLTPSNWASSIPDHERYYCCHIPYIQWHRKQRIILVLIEVVGENDLRDPRTSTIMCNPIESPFMSKTLRRLQNFGGPGRILLAPADANLFYQTQEPGPRGRLHHRCAFQFPENKFNHPGTYFFCYANRKNDGTIISDFEEIPIFTIAADERGLSIAAFERASAAVGRKLFFEEAE